MNEQEIILSQIAAIYDIAPFVRVKEGEMKKILRCCGLGEYYEKYSEYLEPYYYNRGFQNNNPSYRIFVGLDNIFIDLINNDKSKLLMLLTELGKNISPGVIDDEFYGDSFLKLKQLYSLMGLNIDVSDMDTHGYRITITSLTNQTEQLSDDYGMEKWLKQDFSAVYSSYKSALESFALGNLTASVESCRTALTGLFSQFKGVPFQNAKWMLGLATLTGDFSGTSAADISQMTPIKNAIETHGQKEIADFFGENLDGKFKKTKAIYSIYSMLSDYGTHSQEGTPEVLTNEDALMMIRMTTDILVWVYQKQTP